jgi:hypothetical protein
MTKVSLTKSGFNHLFFLWRHDLMILMRENPLLWPLEGVDPENHDFLGPNGIHFARCHFRAQKVSIFRAHPFQRPSKLDFPASKSRAI